MEEKTKKNITKWSLIGLGVLSGGLIIQNAALRNSNNQLRGENETLRKDNQVLTEELKKAWYHLGKLITTKILKR